MTRPDGASCNHDRPPHDTIWICPIGDGRSHLHRLHSSVTEIGWRWHELPDGSGSLATLAAQQIIVVLAVISLRPETHELLRKLAGGYRLPVVVLSASYEPTDVSAALAAGAEDALPLLTRAEEVLARLQAVARVCYHVPLHDGQ